MDKLIEFIVNNESLILVGLFIVVILLMIAILATDHSNRKKQSKNSNNIVKSTDEEFENVEQYTKPIEDNKVISEIKYVEEDTELEKTKAQEELKQLKEILIKEENEKKLLEEQIKNVAPPFEVNKVENKELHEEKEIIEPVKEEVKEEIEVIDEVVKPVQETVEKIDEINNNISYADQMLKQQEEEAIISIDQFNEVSDKLYQANEENQYKDDGNEPISIQELEELYKTQELNLKKVEEEVSVPEKVEIKPVETKPIVSDIEDKYKESSFQSSPIISPVYGFKNTTVITEELENTRDMTELNEELRKTTQFLNTLKELRKNLQ